MREVSYSVQKDSGDRLDKAAKAFMKRDHVTYREGLRVAMKELPQLASAWDLGVRTSAKKDYDLRPSEQVMLRLQNDSAYTMKLAGDVLNSAAMQMAGSSTGRLGLIGQASPERFRDALRSLYQQFPSLAEAASSGFISATDWELASALVPSISSEVRSLFGVGPLNLRSGNYADSRDVHVYRDSRGHEVHRY